jgi:hypothetical protein
VIEKIEKKPVYEAYDGRIFFDKDSCLLYENLLDIGEKYSNPFHFQIIENVEFRNQRGLEFYRVCNVEEFRELFFYFSKMRDSAFASAQWTNLTDSQIQNQWVGKWFFPYIYYYPDSCHEVELITIEHIMESKEEYIQYIQKELQELYKVKYNSLDCPHGNKGEVISNKI